MSMKIEKMKPVYLLWILLLTLMSHEVVGQHTGNNLHRLKFIGVNEAGDSIYSELEIGLSAISVADSSIANKIAQFIEARVIEDMGLDSTGKPHKSILDAGIAFEAACRGEDESSLWASWYYSANSAVLFQNKNMMTVELAIETYAGGAHPSHYITLHNFNVHDGRPIAPSEWITDMNELRRFSENYFWETVESAFDEGTDRTEFFWGDVFALPANLGLYEGGLLLFYNEYEVAPYVFGAIPVDIPMTNIQHLLKKEYFSE